jgi:hypothetical protein
MNATSANSMINRFITAELEMIYEKYNSILDEEKVIVASFIERLEHISLGFNIFYDPYKNYEITKDIAETLKDEEDIHVVTFFLFLKLKLGIDVEVTDVKSAHEDLSRTGYSKLQGYHFYQSQREDLMIEIAEDELDSKLDYSCEVVDLFDHEELASMWVAGTSKTEAAKDYLRENNWWDVIDCSEPEEGYTDSKGKDILFCYDGNY